MPVPDISPSEVQAHPLSGAGTPGQTSHVGGTQSLVRVIAECWHRPALLGLELAWRWGFGIPALALVAWLGWRLAVHLPLDQIDPAQFSLRYPIAASQWVVTAVGLVGPPILHLVRWLAPLLAVLWAVASGLGRNIVLRRLDPQMRSAPLTLIWLQLLRIAALGATIAGWWYGLHWAAATTLGGAEPNLVGYFAWAICLSLGAFAAWALLSWILSIAPMIAMIENVGVAGSLARSLRLGGLASKLAEVNLILGIIKIILVLLALILSATPVPFTATMQGPPLYMWWAGVTVVYLAFSDFFQVARLGVFIRLWRASRTPADTPAA